MSQEYVKIISDIEDDEVMYGILRYEKKYGIYALRQLFENVEEQIQSRYAEKTVSFSQNVTPCPCVKAMETKTHLSHRERLVLINLLLWYGSEGESQLREILEKQDNYKESITNYQIDLWKKKGGNKPIKKVTLKEWGICKCQ